MAADALGLEIIVEQVGHRGVANVTAKLEGQVKHCDRFDLHKATARDKFLDETVKACPTIDREYAKQLLLDAVPPPREDDDGEGDRENQAQTLLRLAEPARLWHTADSLTFATIAIDGHQEHHRIKSTPFRQWMTRLFHVECDKPPSSEALQGVLNVLEAHAQFDGPTEQVWLRTAGIVNPNDPDHETLYLDLCNDRWQVVEIDRTGWRVLDESPVKFRRARGMLPLPVPIRGGTLADLRKFVNLPAPEDPKQPDSNWMLYIAVQTAALRPYGPYPVLEVTGEQGCAKSTTGRVFRGCVDPHKTMLRSMPKEPRDLMISATNCWLQAFDNLSNLPEWLSDALCRQSTGGGFSIRQLYTDDEEVHFDTMRPVLLTGINSVVDRDDLGDRLIRLVMSRVDDDVRLEERIFWREFEAAHPKILGVLLDAVAGGLRTLPSVQLDLLPRMADFARWGESVGRALGWEEGAFLAAYEANRNEASKQVVEDSAVATAVCTFMKDTTVWEGTATKLLAALEEIVGEAVVKDKERKPRWPKTPRGLSNQLRRLAPALRKVDLTLVFDLWDDTKTHRLLQIQKGKKSTKPEERGKAASGASSASATTDGNDGTSFSDKGLHQTNGQASGPTTLRPPSSPVASGASGAASGASAQKINCKPNCPNGLSDNGQPTSDAMDTPDAKFPTSPGRPDKNSDREVGEI